MDNNKPFFMVMGLGKTGLSVARYLRRKKNHFVMADTRPNPEGLDDFEAEFPDVEVFLESFPSSLFDNLLAIICSPGVALDLPFMQTALNKNIPIYGDIECFAREVNGPVIAITGTNGKSTVTTLVGEMAFAAGRSVAVAGNIGKPVLDLLDNGVDYDLWVLELSSFQLDLTHSLAPIAATILNVSSDHLDRHHSLQSYIAAKQRAYHQAQVTIYNRADSQTIPIEGGHQHEMISFGLDAPMEGHWGLLRCGEQSYLACGHQKLLSVDDVKIKGRHNWENALAACALAQAAGIDSQYMAAVLKTFPGLPHRAQWVRTINGVDWINDSKGTNIGATCSAISGIGDSMHGKLVLIAGGQGKGADFSELRAPIAAHVRSLVLIGADADKMEHALGSVVDVLRAPSLEEAVRLANLQAVPGDVVMLSPACASLDMFHDFNERGEVFMSAVNAL
jgi:UDP-N-acetylmuramoylalanine--D-glutamate ligase